MTQEELAEKAEQHSTYMEWVERANRSIILENIITVAKALGCSPKDLRPD